VGGRLVGAEALLRWRHPERGLLAPDVFLPLAEESGLLLPLGRWVIERALRDSLSLPGLRVSVNLSPSQLRDAGLVPFLREALAHIGADARRIEIEVTESVFLSDEGSLAELRRMGFSLAIDDFGTGFSALGYLRRVPCDRLKLDRSFVAEIEHDQQGRAVAAAVAQLAAALGLATTAEGVETAGEAALLRGMGFTHLQGWRYGRPEGLAALRARLGMQEAMAA